MQGRYERQVMLWGEEGQGRLRSSTVVVAGVGGLGSNAALILALEGVGRLVLIDRDTVEESNLNRQPLYTLRDVGRPKAEVAAERLRAINPEIHAEAHVFRIAWETLPRLREIISRANLVIDGLDSWEARHVLDAAAWSEGKPLVHGAVEEWRGQLTTIIPGLTPCLRCLVPKPAPPRPVPVAPPLVALVASLQALEATRILLGMEPLLANKLLYIDALRAGFETIELGVRRDCIETCRGSAMRGYTHPGGHPPAC